jgi:hypothetical protein
MKVKNIVNDFLINSSPMHKMRRLALVECINSIVNGNSLTVTIMGRGIESKTFEKHSIKRSDRLCSNDHLPTTTYTGRKHRYMAASVNSGSL